MKKIIMALGLVLIGVIGTANAAEDKTEKYFSDHIEEARATAKSCDMAQAECKNAKRAVWFYDHSGKKKSAPETKPKSEPVKK